MKVLKALFHLFIIVLLTAVTQIGGLLYLVSIVLFRKKRSKKYLFFFGIYLLFTFLIVPIVAPFFGREKIRNSNSIKAHSFFFILCNRNYVTPKLNDAIEEIALDFNHKFKGAKLIYLDAGFPFVNKFLLLPHLSHNDGKKLDLSLIYEKQGEVMNKKPSVSGYGVYEGPKPSEYNQIEKCKSEGNWQYDFPEYLTFGTLNKNIQFSEEGTKQLLQSILKQSTIGKVFIEPHLKHRLGLSHSKIRYHGCQAVRHDDHIHIQLKQCYT